MPHPFDVLEERMVRCESCDRTLDRSSFFPKQLNRGVDERRCKQCSAEAVKLQRNFFCLCCSRTYDRSSFSENQLKKSNRSCKTCLSTEIQCHFCCQLRPLPLFSLNQKSRVSPKCKLCVYLFLASTKNDLRGADACCKIAMVYYRGNALHEPDQQKALLLLRRAAQVKESPAIATAQQLGIELSKLETAQHLGLDVREVRFNSNTAIARVDPSVTGAKAFENQEQARSRFHKPEEKFASVSIGDSVHNHRLLRTVRVPTPTHLEIRDPNLFQSPQDEQPGFVCLMRRPD
eukprot:g70529.t1